MADSTLNILIRLKNTAQAGLNKLKKTLREAAGAADQLSSTDVDELEDSVEDLNKDVKSTAELTEEAAFEFNNLKDAAVTIAAIGAALAAPFLAAAKAAGEFQTQIAEIETLVAPTATANAELRDSVIELSNEFGIDRARVAAALYQTISTGAKAGAEANKQLAVALTLARGGVADVESVTKGLASVLNAFQLEASEAARVADSLFTTVKGGATTIDELSGFLFQAAPLANALSVDFTELNAAIQTITLSGTPTAQATTQIRAALQGLARDTPEVVEALGEFGSVSEAIAEIGLQATFDQIRKASKGSEAQLIKLIGSIEGVQAILQLTGKASDRFTQALKDQDEASGAAARAADIMEQSFGVQLETALTRISNAFTQLGEAVIPILEPIVVGVGELAQAFQQLLAAESAAQTVAQVALGIIALTVAFGGALGATLLLRKGLGLLFGVFKNFGRGLKLFAIQMTRAAGATRLMGVAAKGLLGPIGFVVGILITLGTTALAFASDMDEVTEAIDTSIESFQALSELDKIQALEIASTALADLNTQLDEAKDKLEQLIGRQERGNPLQQLLTTESDIEDQQAKVTALQESVDEASESFDILTEKSEINIGNIDASNAGINTLVRQMQEAENRALAFEGAIENLRAELDEPIEGLQIESLFGEESVVTRAASAARSLLASVQELIIEGKEKELAKELEIVRITKEKLNVINSARVILREAGEDAEKAAARELSDAEKLAAAKASVNITSAQNRLSEAQAKGAADVIRLQNEALTTDLQKQLDERLINEEEFAAEREKILLSQLRVDESIAELQLTNARKLTDAKIDVIEKGINRQRLLEDAASTSETATSSGATLALVDAQIQVLELGFDATEATITARLEALGLRTKAQIKEIADDLAEGSIEGIEKAFDRLLATQEAKVNLANAQLAAGSITLAQAQSKIAEAAAETASVLEGELIPAVEALLILAPTDPALLLFLEQLNDALETTQTSLSEFQQGIATLLEAELANFFEDLLNGFDSLSEAADKFIQGLRTAIIRLISEKLAQKLVTSLFGFLSGSDGGLVTSPAGGGYIQAAEGGVVEPARFTKAAGGGVLKLARGSGPGGSVRGPGTSTSDSIPAMLSDGEYVMKAKAVKNYGVQMMEAINRGIAPKIDVARRLSITKPPRRRFQEGGSVGSPPTATQLRAGASASGQQRSEQPTELILNVSDDALNSMFRDILEREFGRILATR